MVRFLSYRFRGEEAESFSIINDLEQLIKEPTHIPDRSNQFLNTLDLCFTTSPSLYRYAVLAPIGRSDHNLITLNFQAFSPTAPPCPKRTFLLTGRLCVASMLTILGWTALSLKTRQFPLI